MPKLTDQIRQCVELLCEHAEPDECGEVSKPTYRCLLNLADLERLLAEYEVEQLPEVVDFDPCRVEFAAQESGLPSVVFGRDHYVEIPRLVVREPPNVAEADALHALLMGRADALMGCLEGSEEEVELQRKTKC